MSKSAIESSLSMDGAMSPVMSRRRPFSKLRISNALLRECLAEFLGTMVLIMFGDGVVAQTVLSAGGAGSALSIHICWGLAVLFGILVSAGVSGAHLNPAVSIALAAFGKFDWRKLGPYIASQMLGAFTGAALVYSVYIDSLNAYDGGVRTVTGPTATAGIFSTYPQPYMTHLCSFWTEMVGSALLMGGIFAIGDSKNANLPGAAGPFTVAALVASIGMAFGYPTGYAINPARDFGPRFFTFIAGWGSEVFTASGYYFLVPLFAPNFGTCMGGFVYTALVSFHHKPEEEEQDTVSVSL